MKRGHPQLSAGLLLHPDVSSRVNALADQHGGQAGLGFAFSKSLGNLFFDFIADFLRNGSSVN
jgi:hypothetical protein